MINEHYVASGGNQNYRTPLDLAQDVRDLFGAIGLDPCCSENNLRAEVFYKDNGLTLPWFDRTWCNPPYADASLWVAKCVEEAQLGHRIGLLLSVARTEQAYIQAMMVHTSCIQLLNTKLRHSEGKQAMLASVIYWFNVPADEVRKEMGHRGILLEVA